MTKIKLILIVSFLVTLAAGLASGVLIAHLKRPPPPGPSWLNAELNLTATQREQMHQIWSEVMGDMSRQRGDQGRVLRQQRDQKILDLLTPEQRTQYDTIQKEYAAAENELSEQRKKKFDEAVRRTKEMLTPEQATKYDELMQKQRERGRGPGGPRGGRRGPPGGPGGPPDGPPHDGPPTEGPPPAPATSVK